MEIKLLDDVGLIIIIIILFENYIFVKMKKIIMKII